MLCFSKFIFEIGQDGPFSTGCHNIIHLQQGFRTMFLKHDAVGFIPREGTEWEIASLLKLFNG
jgi:hypothetical protein